MDLICLAQVIDTGERVRRGAAWLDANLRPDWADRIDLWTLDVSAATGCVLVQANNAPSWHILREWDAESDEILMPDEGEDIEALGFEQTAAFDGECDLLNEAWHHLIGQRQAHQTRRIAA